MKKLVDLTKAVLWSDILRVSRRAGRYEYLWGVAISSLLYPFIVQTILLIAVELFVASGPVSEYPPKPTSELSPSFIVLAALQTAIGLHVLLAFATLSVRRLHDLGLSGWYLAALVPIYVAAAIIVGVFGVSPAALQWYPISMLIGVAIFLALGIPKSSDKPNRWGKYPGTWPPDSHENDTQDVGLLTDKPL